MKIDADKIIAETIAAFEYSGAADLYRRCTDLVSEVDYKRLHPNPLTPLDIKIDPEQFNKEITQYDSVFEQWGNDHTHLPRFGAALVNRDGELSKNDPTNGSLMAWNKVHPTQPLLETDCCSLTAIMDLPSLQPLRVLDGHWCRSNILKWHKDAMFVPHIDTIVPSMWIRLWASMSSDLVVRFAKDGELVPVEFEAGRVYIVDTSLVHDAYATNNAVHQLFLSVVPRTNILLERLCQQ
jgi:hypothetical protein